MPCIKQRFAKWIFFEEVMHSLHQDSKPPKKLIVYNSQPFYTDVGLKWTFLVSESSKIYLENEQSKLESDSTNMFTIRLMYTTRISIQHSRRNEHFILRMHLWVMCTAKWIQVLYTNIEENISNEWFLSRFQSRIHFTLQQL